MKKFFISIILLFSLVTVRAQQPSTIDQMAMLEQYANYYQSGDYKKAFETVVYWFNNTKSAFSAALLADALQTGLGTEVNYSEALRLHKAVADSEPPSDDESLQLIRSYCCRSYGALTITISGGEPTAEGINYLKRSVSLTDDAMALTLLGMFAMDERKEEGMDYLRRAAERNSIIALEILGEEAAEREDMDQAISYWEKAATTPLYDIAKEVQRNAYLSFIANPNLKSNPAVIQFQREACIQLGSIYYEMEENTAKTALNWLNKIVKDDDRSLALKAFCYARVNRMDDTRTTFLDLYNRTHNVEYLTSLGIPEYYHGSLEESKKWLRKAMDEGSMDAKEAYNEFFNNQ